MSKESKERNLDARMLEHADRCEQQEEPDNQPVLIQRRLHDHRLADKAAKQRYRGDGRGADDAQYRGLGHRPEQPAQIGGPGAAGHGHHRAHGHKQQALEQHIVERVGHRDELEVWIEISEELFADEMRKLRAFEEEVRERIESMLGLDVKVRLVEPKTIERYEGKASRVVDRRNL